MFSHTTRAGKKILHYPYPPTDQLPIVIIKNQLKYKNLNIKIQGSRIDKNQWTLAWITYTYIRERILPWTERSLDSLSLKINVSIYIRFIDFRFFSMDYQKTRLHSIGLYILGNGCLIKNLAIEKLFSILCFCRVNIPCLVFDLIFRRYYTFKITI